MASRIGTAVRIHLHPKPKYLHETRPILDALKKFGEVTTFKNLRFDFRAAKPNHINRCIRVIFDDKEAAERALAASPLTLSIPQIKSTNSNSSSESILKWNPESILLRRNTRPDIHTVNHEITCTIEPDRHTEAMVTPRPLYNVYNTRKRDNEVLKDLEGPDTNIPLPQLADTIRREGMKHHDRQKKPEPTAPTLMELYREGGVRGAAETRDWKAKAATLEEASKTRQATARKGGLKDLAMKKAGNTQVDVED